VRKDHPSSFSSTSHQLLLSSVARREFLSFCNLLKSGYFGRVSLDILPHLKNKGEKRENLEVVAVEIK